MNELYIISKYRIIYMENKKIKWINNIKNTNDYKHILKHLKEFNIRYSIAR